MKKIYLSFVLFCMGLSVAFAQLPQDFEAGIPVGWDVTGDWVLTTTTGFNSQFFNPADHTTFMGFNDDFAGNGSINSGSITTTVIDITGIVKPMLNFAAYFIDGDYGADETAKVLISTDLGFTWTEVGDLGGVGGWQTARVPLFDFENQSIQIRFAYDDGGGWNYGFCIDDIDIVSTLDRNATLDYAYSSCTGGAAGAEVLFSGGFTNNGLEMINSLDINWSDGTNTSTETLTDLNLDLFDSYDFVHPNAHTMAEGANNLEVWVSNINGMTDEDESDNMTSTAYTGIVPKDGRGIFVEEATSTYCTWCTRGHAWMDRLTKCYGQEHFVGVAVHTIFNNASDPMVESTYGPAYTASPDFNGWPDTRLERGNHLDPSQLEGPLVAGLAEDPAVMLENYANFDVDTRELEVIVKMWAPADEDVIITDYSTVIILAEDKVSGTGTGWDQINAYGGGGNGPMGGFELLPNPVPGSMMEYNHTARELLTPYAGTSENMPDTLVAGEIYEVRSTVYAVPADYNYDNLVIMTALLDDGGLGVNATAGSLDAAVELASGINTTIANNYKLKVYPNPTSDFTNISITLEESQNVQMSVFNNIGQQVGARDYGKLSGNMILPFDASRLDSGIYHLTLTIGSEIVTKTVVVK